MRFLLLEVGRGPPVRVRVKVRVKVRARVTARVRSGARAGASARVTRVVGAEGMREVEQRVDQRLAW